MTKSQFRYLPQTRIVIIVGNFGSGKTEVSVHLALHLSQAHAVQIVDLDIVNPYFRCREAREEMEAHGITVTYPKGEFHSADLPIILPEMKSAAAVKEGYIIFDVGGDDMGARVLSSLADVMADQPYSMLQVINTSRPFTRDVAGCIKMKDEIEAASRLKVTGVIANTHLMDQTESANIKEGIEVARAVAAQAGLSLEFSTIDPTFGKELNDIYKDIPLLPIERRMLPPWRLRSMTDKAGRILKKN
ncbi:MAG: cobalamin biosynthesis protein CbiA [Candidatus Latescibacterota bacterium]